MKVTELFESQQLDEVFIAAVKAAVKNPDLRVVVGRWKKFGRWNTREVNIEYGDKGFAQAVIWKNSEEYRFQQHDISLPEAAQGKGIGGEMVAALVAGYKAVGQKKVPVHLVTNPEFWNAMQKKHKIFDL